MPTKKPFPLFRPLFASLLFLCLAGTLFANGEINPTYFQPRQTPSTPINASATLTLPDLTPDLTLTEGSSLTLSIPDNLTITEPFFSTSFTCTSLSGPVQNVITYYNSTNRQITCLFGAGTSLTEGDTLTLSFTDNFLSTTTETNRQYNLPILLRNPTNETIASGITFLTVGNQVSLHITVVLAPPTNLIATVTGNDITLTWTPSPSIADGYYLYHKPSTASTWSRLTLTPASLNTYTFFDQLPATYEYRLVTVAGPLESDPITTTATIHPNTCGNGVIEGSEECDDGNTTTGDGCSSTCRTEGDGGGTPGGGGGGGGTTPPEDPPEDEEPCTFEVYGKPEKRYQNRLTLPSQLKFYDRNTGELKKTVPLVLNRDGYRQVETTLPLGTYNVILNGEAHLNRIIRGIIFSNSGEIITLDFTFSGVIELLAGDTYDDDIVNATDISRLLMQYSTQGTSIISDLNKDYYVNAPDIALLITNYFLRGEKI